VSVRVGLGGVDGVPKAVGHEWNSNPRHLNSPTVYNAVLVRKQFWDGRADSLEEQAKRCQSQAPVEMGINV